MSIARSSLRKPEAGFTLLEAIVAMTLIAIAGMALFSWINASFDTISRVSSSNARAKAQMNAMEWVKTLNPMKNSSGEEVQGALRIRWQSRAISPLQTSLTEMNEPGTFIVALYEVEVTVEEPPVVERFSFNLRQMGYRRLDDTPGGEFTD